VDERRNGLLIKDPRGGGSRVPSSVPTEENLTIGLTSKRFPVRASRILCTAEGANTFALFFVRAQEFVAVEVDKVFRSVGNPDLCFPGDFRGIFAESCPV